MILRDLVTLVDNTDIYNSASELTIELNISVQGINTSGNLSSQKKYPKKTYKRKA